MSIDNTSGKERLEKLKGVDVALDQWRTGYFKPILERDPGIAKPFNDFHQAIKNRISEVTEKNSPIPIKQS